MDCTRSSSIVSVLLSPDIAAVIAAYQKGWYADMLGLRSKLCPIYKNFYGPSFVRPQMQFTHECLQQWLGKYGIARVPKLVASCRRFRLVLTQYAIYFGDLEMATMLHARLDLCSFHEPLAELAAMNGQTHMIQYLRDIGHPGDDSYALQWATELGHLRTVKYLREIGKTVMTRPKQNSQYAVHSKQLEHSTWRA
ncbi:hypothetical protein LEN26_007059 [Aphanomyces euteiches]|nr:hypothetical protein AeMF1_004022 [Aphanomyces euteiches]KAH9133605.1 hypothetical protein LEN26_007059 [Aphanomyces euteiches]KAH9184331.1 hypothetical protein AeNC1_013691 [Aphanomyces euteiches]